MGCATLKELHDLLCAKVRQFFEQLEDSQVRIPCVPNQGIHPAELCRSTPVCAGCKRTRPSVTQLCVYGGFKKQTGQTLNQYLTDYRIKMSKQVLKRSPL